MTVPNIEPLESRIAPATLTITSPNSVNEGTVTGGADALTTPYTFTLTLDAAVTVPVSLKALVTLSPAPLDGNPHGADGDDFLPSAEFPLPLTPLDIEIPAGTTSKTFTILVKKDAIYENDGAGESFTVTFSNLTGVGVNFPNGANNVVRNPTIANDDAKPTLSIEKDVKVDEGDTGTTDAVFRAKLSNPADKDITFDWLTAFSGELNPAGPSDFTPIAKTTFTIPALDTFSQNMIVVVTGDTVDEKEEDFLVKISNAKIATKSTTVFDTLAITDTEAKGLIGNDEVRVKIAGAPSVVEGNTGSTPAAFTVSLPAGVTRNYPITVNVKVAGNGANPAKEGTDVVATASVVIPAGQNSATLNVGVFGDLVFEGDETFLVTLDNVVNAAIDGAAKEATGTILAGGDPLPTVSILAPTVVALNEGSTTDGKTDFVFKVRLSQPSSVDAKVIFTLSGTANGSDYVIETQPNVTMLTATMYEVKIPAGQQEANFTVRATHDRMFEADETIIATISLPATDANATLGTAVAQATIRNDEEVPRLRLVGEVRNEGNAGDSTQFQPRVQLVDSLGNSMTADRDITFSWETVGGTALAGSDFSSQSTTGTVPAGQAEVALPIAGIADDVDEPDEKFSVQISAGMMGTTALTLATTTAEVTILNDDLTVSVPGTVSVSENGGEAVILVTLSAVSTHDVTVAYSLLFDTAKLTSDFTNPANLTVTFPAGMTTAEIRVPIVNDGIHEQSENFTVNLARGQNANTVQGSATTTVTINDDEATPQLTVESVTVAEGAGIVNVTVRSDVPSDRQISFNWNTVNGSAVGGATEDFTAVPQPGGTATASILAGSLTTTLQVTLRDDAIFEGAEQFSVLISNLRFDTGTGAPAIAPGGDTATVTITDNEAVPTLKVEQVPDSIGAEGNAGDTRVLRFKVTPSTKAKEPIQFTWSTVAGGSAFAGTDYTPVAPTAATIPGDTAEFFISVPIIGDGDVENDETVFVSISNATLNPAGAPVPLQISTNLATGTIQNDEATLTISDATVVESVTPSGTVLKMIFTVSLAGAAASPVTVNVGTKLSPPSISGPIPATAVTDFVSKAETLTFNLGETTKLFEVEVKDDTVFEGDEVFLAELSSSVNALITDNEGTGTITDNEVKPGIRVADARIVEGDTGEKELRFRVTLANLVGTDYVGVTATKNVTFKWEAKAGGMNAASGAPAPAPGSSDPLPAGTDFLLVPISATPTTISAGQQFVELTVKLKGDLVNEADETFIIELSDVKIDGLAFDAGQISLSDLEATGTIQNDDLAVRIAGGAVTEGNTGTVNRNFDISIPQTVGFPVTVIVEVADGTAKLGEDYFLTGLAPVPGKPNQFSVTIPAGQTVATLSVPIIGDTLDEVNETFTATLVAGSAVNAVISTTADKATATITDDDNAPTLRVEVFSTLPFTEGDSGSPDKDFVFTVTLSAPSGQTVSVLASSVFGTATVADLTANSETLTFQPARPDPNNVGMTLPAETSKTFTLKVKGDALDESDEVFTVVLSNAAGATIDVGTATGTITDNDAAPVVSVADLSIEEGNPGGTSAYNFTISLSAPSGLPVTVDATTVQGSALPGGAFPDYTNKSEPFTFAPGQTSKTFTVLVNRDSLFEADETFSVSLSNVVNATAGVLTAIGTIRNDDAEPTLSIGDANVTEGNTGSKEIEFTVSLSSPSAEAVTFDWAAVNGSATSPDDYAAVTMDSTVTIPAGQTSAKLKFNIVGDTTDEADENFFVNVTNVNSGGRALTITDGQGEAKIINDDLSISVEDVTVVEGNSGETNAVFKIKLSAASTHPVTVHYRTQDGTAVSTGAAADFTAIGDASVTFAPGETEKLVEVKVIGDLNYDLANAFTLSLSQPEGARILDGEGTGTITDDDVRPVFAISDVSRLENADAPGSTTTTGFSFHITLSTASDESVEVSATTFDGTALGGQDFTAISGRRIIFAPGETDKTVVVNVLNDSVFEGDEQFKLRLHNPLRATFGASVDGLGTIGADDDAKPKLEVSGGSIVEGNSGEKLLNFTVTRTGGTGKQIKFTPEAFLDTDDDAVAGVDFELVTPGEVTMEPTETTKTVSVRIFGDAIIEGDESFSLRIKDLVDAEPLTPTDGPAKDKAKGTILDDDARVQFVPVTASVAEGATGQTDMVFIVKLSGPAVKATTINYTVAAGTATAAGPNVVGADFQAPALLSIIIPVGSDTGEIRVPVLGDLVAEADETLTVTLTSVTNGALEAANLTATGTIENDDAALRIGDVRVVEGLSGTTDMRFLVTLEDAATFPVTVHFTTQPTTSNPASIGTDFGTVGQTAISGDLTFLAGETSKEIVIPIIGDSIFEGDELIRIVLSDAKANGVAISALLDAEGIGTIADDDALLSISDVTVQEGNGGTSTAVFTVTMLPAGVTRPVTVKVSTVDGTAVSTGAIPDFVAKTETLTFNTGQTTKTFSVVINGDLVPEALTETFKVVLSEASGAAIQDGEGAGIIETGTGQPAPNQAIDDPLPAISIADAAILEGESGTKQLDFTVTLTQASSADVTFTLASANVTTDAADFTALPATTFTIPAGEKTLKVSIPIIGDTNDEVDETFTLTLTNAKTNIAGADRVMPIADGTATGRILTDDRTVSVGSAILVEGNSGDTVLNVPVSIPTASNFPVTVTFTVTAGTATAGTDFTMPTTLTATIPALQTTVNIPITVKGDAIFENDETLTVMLTGATGAVLGTATATGTITNDDAVPTVTILDLNGTTTPGDVSVNEGSTASFTVKLNSVAERDITVRYVTLDGTAEGDDYAQNTLERALVIPAGQAEGRINIGTIQDTRDELDETFQIKLLADAANGVAADIFGTATIRADQNDLSTLSISDAQVVEGNDGTRALTFTVSRTGTSALLAAAVNYTVANGTAIAGEDFEVIAPGTLTFLAGERTKTVSVIVMGDTTGEADETLFVTLSGVTGAKLGTSQALGRILNDEVEYKLNPTGTVTVTEGDATQVFAEFEVVRMGAAGTLVFPGTVTFTTEAPASGVAATAGTDYTVTTGTISFPSGSATDVTQTATQKIRVPIVGDTLLEADETFVVRLTGSTHGVLSANGNDRATVTIEDNDEGAALPVVRMDTPTVTTVEGADGTTKNMQFIVKLVDVDGNPKAAAGEIEILYSTADGTATAGQDFTGATDLKLIIAAGQTQGTILIPISGDGTDEVDEDFTLNLTSAKLRVPGVEKDVTVDQAAKSATGKITNDDLTATVSQLDGAEGNVNGTRTFTVKLSQASTHPVTLKYLTVDGSAKTGDDFAGVATATTIMVPANVAEHTFTIGIVGDLYSEGNESFTVQFSDITNALLGTSSVLVNIFNDDAAPTLTIGDASVVEGDSGTLSMVFTVTLAGATREKVLVDYATSDGTAKAGGPVPDYVAKRGTVEEFPADATGGLTRTISIPIVGDNWRELTENFTVTLSNARLGTEQTGVTIANAVATGEITDGDTTLGVFVADTRTIEGSVLAFSVQTTAPTPSALAFKASTRPGTANTEDFVALNGASFTIAANSSSVTVTVTTRADVDFELTEFLFLDVNGLPVDARPVGGSGGTVSARGYLLADDLERVSDREFNYVDVDGDIVNVKFSKGTLAIPLGTALETNDLRFAAGGSLGGRFLELINLTNDGFEFEGASITVRAEPQVLANGEVLGDGRGDVGLIFAAVPNGNLFQFTNGISLGTVKIDGDLGRLFAGSTLRPSGVGVLELGSFGVRAQDSNSPASGNSIVLGPIGKMIVHGNVGGSLSVIGDSFNSPLPSGPVGRIGSLVIEGVLKGGTVQDSGRISYTGGIGKAVIGKIEGGSGQNSGALRPFDSQFVTKIGKLTVTGGITGGAGQESGYVEANTIGSLVLGKLARKTDAEVLGNLTGGGGQRSGLVTVDKTLGSVFIHGDVTGGTAGESGRILVGEKLSKVVMTGNVVGAGGGGSGTISAGQLGTVAVHGDITGGGGANSGAVSSTGFTGNTARNDGDVSKVTIGKVGNGKGDITGGAGQGSGGVFTNGKAGQVTVHGSITGGAGNFSGALVVSGALAKGTVNGDLIGGDSPQGTAALISSGFISAENIANLIIKGNITAGKNNGGGLTGSGAVRANEQIGKLKVNGNVTGNATAAAIISARDGIGSVHIGGNAEFAEVLAGYVATNSGTQPRGLLQNAGAGIGSVIIAGSMKASSIVAGVFAGADGKFGTDDDDEESNGTNQLSGQDLVARIASVKIGSVELPPATAPADASFGIVAEQVVSVKIGGAPVTLLAGVDNDRKVPVGDAATKLKVHET